MTFPTFASATGPLTGDLADGKSAFNALADTCEANDDLLNNWATTIVRSGPVNYSPITFGTGWADFAGTPSAGDQMYARKWGPLTFVYIIATYLGPTVAAGRKGDIEDQFIGTVRSEFRPANTQIANGSSGTSCQCRLGTDGQLVLVALHADGATLPTNKLIRIPFFFINLDQYL